MLLTDQSAHQTMGVHRRSRNWRDNDLPAGFGADPCPMPSVASSTSSSSSSSWGFSSATSPLIWIAGFGAVVTIITKNILMGLVTGATAWVTWTLFRSPTCDSSPGVPVRPADVDQQPPAHCPMPPVANVQETQETPLDAKATTPANATDSPATTATAPVDTVTLVNAREAAAARAETESSGCESDDGDDGDDGFELISLNDLDAASRM